MKAIALTNDRCFLFDNVTKLTRLGNTVILKESDFGGSPTSQRDKLKRLFSSIQGSPIKKRKNLGRLTQKEQSFLIEIIQRDEFEKRISNALRAAECTLPWEMYVYGTVELKKFRNFGKKSEEFLLNFLAQNLPSISDQMEFQQDIRALHKMGLVMSIKDFPELVDSQEFISLKQDFLDAELFDDFNFKQFLDIYSRFIVTKYTLKQGVNTYDAYKRFLPARDIANRSLGLWIAHRYNCLIK